MLPTPVTPTSLLTTAETSVMQRPWLLHPKRRHTFSQVVVLFNGHFVQWPLGQTPFQVLISQGCMFRLRPTLRASKISIWINSKQNKPLWWTCSRGTEDSGTEKGRTLVLLSEQRAHTGTVLTVGQVPLQVLHCTSSPNPPRNPTRRILGTFPFHRWAPCSSERWSDWAQDSQ